MNIAYEKRYQDWQAQYEHLFAPENHAPQQDEQFQLTDGYSVRSKAYFHNGDLHLNGSESELLDKAGTVRYAWRNLDTDAEFCSLFRHRNGNHYLIFRTELYGYSVLEVESGQEMHYVPACVHPEEGQKARKYSFGPAPPTIPTVICWPSPAASGPAPTPPLCWTFPALSSPSPRSGGWICGASLTRTIPGSMILSSSAGKMTH